MAFPVPTHLPRKIASNDATSNILSKIDSASLQSVNSSLATSWIAELDESIHCTKASIRARIQEDLPKFTQQLETSKFVQTRLQHITGEVDVLNEAISNPQTGLVPKTLRTLKAHAALAQESADASVLAESLTHLLRCRQHYTSVMSLVQFGKLPEAVAESIGMEELVVSSPRALEQAVLMKDLKQKVFALKSNVEGQLLDGLSRSLVIQPSVFMVQPQVQVRDTEATIKLDQILASLSPPTINDYLSTFRRDFVSHFVDHVLLQPYSLEVWDSPSQYSLTLIPSSPNTERRITRLDNLSSIFDFMARHIFPLLPPSQGQKFLRSLCKPVTTSILNLYLLPQLPSSFGLLPPFLELVRASVDFETRYVANVLDPNSQDRPIKEWSNGLSGHYERQRRTAILARFRELLTEKIDLTATFQVDVERSMDSSYLTVVNGEDVGGEAWGFEGQLPLNTSQTDSWGFNDDAELEPEPEPEPEPEIEVEMKQPGVQDPTNGMNGVNGDEPNPDEAWGWNDDETVNEEEAEPLEETTEETAWDDDPWADSPSIDLAPEPEAPPVATLTAKSATRLERLALKNKKQSNGTTLEHSIQSPLSLPESNPADTIGRFHKAQRSSKASQHRRPSNIVVVSPMETYRVTTKMKQIVRFVEDVVAESKQFAASNLFAKSPSEITTPGATLIQSASSVMELYQALYPIRFEQELSTVEGAMQFSNDSLYLSDSVDKFEREASNHQQLKERLTECRNDLKILGESWFDDAVNRECMSNDQLMVDGTQRFSFTGDQDRYDECEEAINQVVQNIKTLSRRIKPIPSKSKYYQAVGRLVDAALSRVLHDIIALPDIPELESTRLSELCRIFNSMEGLFSEDPTQSSFVVAYVPSWLKFSYLSELLEATMADLSYLFEQGALVDFEIDELTNLVRALFADTQLRTNTINKLQEGHPAPAAA